MSLMIEVYVGGHSHRKIVARGVLHNVSDLADVSNYVGMIEEFGNDALNIPPTKQNVKITEHPRRSSVWDLILKMIDGKHHG